MQTQPEILTLSVPILKPGEIKPILTEKMKQHHPSFRFLMSTTGVYHFQRLRDFHDYHLKEAIHFVFSLDDNNMNVSISSRLNPLHTLTPVYNNGFINPHVDLGAIVGNAGIFPSHDTAYHFEPSVDRLIPAIDQAIADFGKEGIAYLESRWNNLWSNNLVRRGLEIIDTWEFDKTMLRNELKVQLRKAKLVVNRLRHPVCNDLKAQLEAIPNQTPENHKEIPRLAFELLELYCDSRIIS
jgi:hypothetical protein